MSSPSLRLERITAEPFRIFFPLGIVASIIGVLLWPAYFAGWIETHPLESHARWMVVCFGGCFITGFLATAGPRLLGAAPFCRFELAWHLVMAIAVMALLSFQQIATADLLTGFWLLGVLISLLFRLLADRSDIPPPGLPLAVLGLLGAVLAGFTMSMASLLNLNPATLNFWRLLYFQGFLWLPILGVAPYLLPRFFGRKSPHAFDETLEIPGGWKRPFLESMVAGGLLILSFAIEAWVHPRAGMMLRLAVVGLHLGRSVPGLIAWGKVNALGLALRWTLPCALLGWALAVVFPLLRVGMLHMMFIGSVGLLILAVATRVILGHGNRHDRLASPLRWFHWIWGGLLLTAATRLTSDFVFKVRITHFIYAAILWAVVAVFWWWHVRRELKKPVHEQGVVRKHCPRRLRQLVGGTIENS